MAEPPPEAHGWQGFAVKSDVPFKGQATCSFCGRPEDEQRRLVAGPTPAVAICEDCVRLCLEIFDESS